MVMLTIAIEMLDQNIKEENIMGFDFEYSARLSAERSKDREFIGGTGYWPFGDRYWNIDVAKKQGVKLRRDQRRYKVRNGKIIRLDSPRNIEKKREELAPF